MIIGLLYFTSVAHADELVHKFKNPSFSGIGTSSHYLTIENQEFNRRQAIADEILKHNARTILKEFHKNEVPAAPILSRTEILKNEQVNKNKIIEIHTSKFFGKVRSPRPAAIYSESTTKINRLAPLLGENSYEILEEIGIKKTEIEQLIKNKITSIV